MIRLVTRGRFTHDYVTWLLGVNDPFDIFRSDPVSLLHGVQAKT